MGELYRIQNGNGASAADVSYINDLNESVCTTLGIGGFAGDTQDICISAGTSSSILAYTSTDGSCTGDLVVIAITDLTTSCGSETPTPTPTPTNTETPTPTPTNTETPTLTPTTTLPFNCSTCSGVGWLPYNINTCYRVSTTSATPPSTPITLSAKTATVNTDFGTQFFSTGFNTNGTGTIVETSTTQNIWRRTQPSGLDGPLNRCALWATDSDPNNDPPYNVWLGFSVCLTGILAEKTYYVGIGADNNYKLTLDGNVILNTVGGPLDNSVDAFKYWHVYPVVIGDGDHTLELFGLNNANIAGFGCEIYDNTLEELTGFTTYSQLNVIFTSSGETQATVVQNLSNQYLSSGYTCTSGVYSACDGNCIQYEYCVEGELPTPTPTQTPTNTETPTQTPTNTETPTNTPTPTETPITVLINPVLISNIDEYISVGNGEYLEFFEPEPTPSPTVTKTPTNTPTPTPTPNAPVTTNLVLYYDPSNSSSYPGTGTTINDLSNNGLNGTMSNITFTTPYFSYNGSSSQVSVADNPLLEPGSGDWSIEFWVNHSVLAGSSRVLIGKTDGGNAADWGYGLRSGAPGNTFMEIGDGSTSITSPSSTLSINTWYQVVGVWTNVASNSLALYINGGFIGSNSHSFTSIKNTTSPLYLGSFNGGQFSQWLNGRMGVVRMYNKALTGSEVLQNFNADKSKYGL